MSPSRFRFTVGVLIVIAALASCSSSGSNRSVSVSDASGPAVASTTTEAAAPVNDVPENLANLWGRAGVTQPPATLSFTPISLSNDSRLGSATTTYAPDGSAMAEYFGSSTIAPFTVKESKSAFSSMADVKSWLQGVAAQSGGQVKVVIFKAGDGSEYAELSGGGAQSLVWQTAAGTRIDVLTLAPTTTDQLESIGAALVGTTLTPETTATS